MDIQHALGFIAFIFVIIGALNWGFVGAFGLDLIARLFGGGSIGARIMYILIGVSALIVLLL